jgi:hypothetical protein
VPTGPPSAAAGPPPFVGREGERAALDQTLASAAAAEGALVHVIGEAGIGKTRLAEDFAVRARAAGARVFWGRAWEEGAPPFWPWVEVLRALFEQAEAGSIVAALGERAGALLRLLPELRSQLPPLSVPAQLEPDRARFLLFDAVAATLAAAAAHTVLVVVLDDFHAADPGSRLLLGFVARRLGTSRIVLLVLAREPVASELARGRTLTLRGLDETQVGALVRGRAGRAARAAVVRGLHQGTGGNPLFVDEVVRVLLAEGRLDEVGPGGRLPLPAGVRDAIRTRCAPLAPAVREMLRLAAVLGVEFELPVLARLAGAPPEQLLDRLGAAVAAGVLVAAPGLPGCYRFTHALVRDALYEELSPAERLGRHREAVLAIEHLDEAARETQLPALAHHALEAVAGADDVARAVGYAEHAARRALALLAPEEAARHCEAALRALAAWGGPEPARVGLLLLRGEAERAAGAMEKARPTFLAAATAARALGAGELLARAALGLGHTGTESGAIDHTLVQLLEEALAATPAADAPLRAHLLGRLAEALYFSPDRARAAALSAEALAMARRLGRDDVLATTLIRRHFAIWGPDTSVERAALAAEAAQAAARTGQREVELVARSWRVADLLERGQAEEADREIAAYREMAEGLGLPEFRWRARLLMGTRALMRGEFEQAAELARQAAAIEDGPHGQNAVQFFAVQRVALALEQGADQSLAEIAEPLRALAERYPTLPVWRSAFARVCAELGRHTEARRDLDLLAADDFAAVPRDGNWLPAVMNLGETAVLLEDRARAARLYALLRPYAGLYVVVAHGAACFGSVERYLGRLAAASGRPRAAARHLARAAAADARTGAAPFVAQAEYALARLRLAGGRPGERARAQLLLERAAASARALGMPRLAARAQALGAAPRARPSAEPVPLRWLFRRTGETWAIGPEDAPAQLRHGRGFEHLHVLLAHPGCAFPAVELAARAGGAAVRIGGAIGPVLDERARREYAGRLADLRSELDEARARRDLGRIAPLEAEIDWLETAVTRATGLGGRARHTGSAGERARTAVTKAIRAALRRIVAASPAVGHHLERSVRTGTLCCYEPDPSRPVLWAL